MIELETNAAALLRENQPELSLLDNGVEISEKAVRGIEEVVGKFVEFVERECSEDNDRITLGITLSTQLETEFRQLRGSILHAGMSRVFGPDSIYSSMSRDFERRYALDVAHFEQNLEPKE